LISEAVRGEGGILRNIHGYRFMPDYAPEKELASRDIVARSIVYEMAKTGADNVFIDVTHLPHNLVTTRFPNIYQFCLDYGLDITKEMVPVAPAAHYFMGGVKVNTWGETNIPGLFAAGETACTGVHGANRLASNSMLEVLVFSKRIMERTKDGRSPKAAEKKKNADEYHLLPARKSRKKMPEISVSNLKNLMWDKVGIIRNQEGLTAAANILAAWQRGLPLTERVSYELSNMILTGNLMAEAALIREESRGAQFRTDFPETSDDWQHHIIFTNK
jgi:L-aspartate oxidase